MAPLTRTGSVGRGLETSMKLVGSGNSKTTEARSKKQGLCCQEHIFRLKKPEQAIKSLLRLARLEGLEPPTYWFVASHSIQLSYKRKY